MNGVFAFHRAEVLLFLQNSRQADCLYNYQLLLANSLKETYKLVYISISTCATTTATIDAFYEYFFPKAMENSQQQPDSNHWTYVDLKYAIYCLRLVVQPCTILPKYPFFKAFENSAHISRSKIVVWCCMNLKQHSHS